MGRMSAAAVCVVLFFTYGLFCQAMGWRNLGGAIPTVVVVLGLGWLWRTLTRPKPTSN